MKSLGIFMAGFVVADMIGFIKHKAILEENQRQKKQINSLLEYKGLLLYELNKARKEVRNGQKRNTKIHSGRV